MYILSKIKLREILIYIGIGLLLCIVILAGWKMSETIVYFPFKIETPLILYNNSETVPGFLGDGYHVQIFKLSIKDFETIKANKDNQGIWLKSASLTKNMIDAFNSLIVFSDPKLLEISNKNLLLKSDTYFNFEYIKSNSEYFESAAVWIYDLDEEMLYYIEASQ